MSGTGKAAVNAAGGDSDANLEQVLVDSNDEITSLDGTDVLDDGEDLEAGGDGSDGNEPKAKADETPEEEVSEDDKPMSAKEKRSLQLTIDKQGNELGLLRKIANALLKRSNKAFEGPSAKEWADNPDEAARAEQESKAEMEAFESENRLIGNRARISEYVPNFDHVVPDIVKILQEDNATPEYIAAFKKTPHAIDPVLAFNLAKRAEQAALIRRLQAKPAAKPDQRGFTPTNDKAGKAPAGVKGPLNYAALEKLANDPAALDAALDSLSAKDQELLLEIGKRKARARR